MRILVVYLDKKDPKRHATIHTENNAFAFDFRPLALGISLCLCASFSDLKDPERKWTQLNASRTQVGRKSKPAGLYEGIA